MWSVRHSVMNRPSVSVITAAYKSEPAHLAAALGSALRQTYPATEIVVSDDSPDDRLRSTITGLSDRRLCYRHNQPALGVARNHWRCLREARGEYIVILNHDDHLESSFLQSLIAPMQADSTLSLAFCDHWIIDSQGNRKIAETEDATKRYRRSELSPGVHAPFYRLLADQTIPMAMGTLFRRSALPKVLPEDAGPAYDLWLTYLLCRGGWGAWYVPERLSAWRAHAGNLTSVGGIALLEGSASCWSTVARDEDARAIRAKALRKEGFAYYACSRWCHREGLRRESRQYAWRSFRAHAHWRALAAYALGALSPRASSLKSQQAP